MSRVAPGLGIEVREGKGRTGGRGGRPRRRRRNINLGGAEEGDIEVISRSLARPLQISRSFPSFTVRRLARRCPRRPRLT